MAAVPHDKPAAPRTPGRRGRSMAPAETSTLPRFAISPELEGHLLAEQILAEFRKDLAALDLTPKKHRRAAPKQGN